MRGALMIQIDDAGSGSLLGGTIIGVLRVETGEYRYGTIPVELYKAEFFKEKKYLETVVDIIQDIFAVLKPEKNEKVYVCRGYMFDRLRVWLKENSYNWESSVIHDPLQAIVEKTFEDYAVSLGLPLEYIRYTKYPFHFHRLLKWVCADYESRKDLCKQGWNSWQKYGALEMKTYSGKAKNSNIFCLKCGNRLTEGSTIKIIQYVTNRLNRVYLHEYC
jgi:hypothetical protein